MVGAGLARDPPPPRPRASARRRLPDRMGPALPVPPPASDRPRQPDAPCDAPGRLTRGARSRDAHAGGTAGDLRGEPREPHRHPPAAVGVACTLSAQHDRRCCRRPLLRPSLEGPSVGSGSRRRAHRASAREPPLRRSRGRSPRAWLEPHHLSRGQPLPRRLVRAVSRRRRVPRGAHRLSRGTGAHRGHFPDTAARRPRSSQKPHPCHLRHTDIDRAGRRRTASCDPGRGGARDPGRREQHGLLERAPSCRRGYDTPHADRPSRPGADPGLSAHPRSGATRPTSDVGRSRRRPNPAPTAPHASGSARS